MPDAGTRTHDLSNEEYEALAAQLLAMRSSGQQEIDLVTHICNRLRIKKPEARVLYDHFDRGFHDGVGASLGSAGPQVQDGEEAVHPHVLYGYALEASTSSTNTLLADRHQERAHVRRENELRQNARVILAMMALAMVVAAGWWILG